MTSDDSTGFADIDRNVAANVRQFREGAELSQDELAQRMTERGFGFTQATIWKIESGQRPIRISEAVALSDALELPQWLQLTTPAEANEHRAALISANRRASRAYDELKAAATNYIQEQVDVLFAVRDAQDAGINTDPWTSWLDNPAERAIIEARIEWEQEDDVLEQRVQDVDDAMDALRRAGYKPLNPDDVQVFGPSAR